MSATKATVPVAFTPDGRFNTFHTLDFVAEHGSRDTTIPCELQLRGHPFMHTKGNSENSLVWKIELPVDHHGRYSIGIMAEHPNSVSFRWEQKLKAGKTTQLGAWSGIEAEIKANSDALKKKYNEIEDAIRRGGTVRVRLRLYKRTRIDEMGNGMWYKIYAIVSYGDASGIEVISENGPSQDRPEAHSPNGLRRLNE